MQLSAYSTGAVTAVIVACARKFSSVHVPVSGYLYNQYNHLPDAGVIAALAQSPANALAEEQPQQSDISGGY